MKPYQLLLGLLVAVQVLAALAVGALVKSQEPQWPEPLAAVVLGTALGQLALAGAWLALGRRFIALRGAVLLVVLLGWLYPVASCIHGSDQQSANTCAGRAAKPAGTNCAPLRDLIWAWWGGILLVHSLGVAGGLTASRLAGARLEFEGAASPPTTNVKPWQFTLGGVLALITLLGMFLGIGRHFAFPWQDFLSAGSFCAGTTAACAISIYVALRLKHVAAALAVPPLLCGGLGVLFWWWMLPHEAFIGLGVLQGAVISISACVLRVAGYRLTRTPVGNALCGVP